MGARPLRTGARPSGLLKVWSGRPDSNPRPPAPHAGALPGCATPRTADSEVGLGGRVRTCDLMLPKHPRCQLRYAKTMEPCGRHGRTRTDALCVPNAADYLAFPHADVNDGGCKWIRTIDIRLIKTVLYQLSYATRELDEDGSPRRDRTAALLVNSQALYRLSYRGKEANSCSTRRSAGGDGRIRTDVGWCRRFCRPPLALTGIDPVHRSLS